MKTFPIVPSPLAKLLSAVCLIALPAAPWAQAAGVTDDFSYPDGALTAVSGGAWQPWEAGAQDAAVSGGAMRFQGNTDVIRTFPPVLTATGDRASISFTILVNIADTTEGFAMDFLPASAPFADPGGTNYANQFSLGFDYRNSTGNSFFTDRRASIGNSYPMDHSASIDIATGNGSGSPVTPLGEIMTENVTHLFRIDLARGADNTSYSLFMDGNLLHQGTFVLTDPRGMNAVELEQSGEQSPSTAAFAVVDNLSIVPVVSVTPVPEIVVEQLVGSDFASGDIQGFSSTATGASTSVTFSIRNDGSDDLTGLGITIDGTNGSDFEITTAPVAPISPAGVTSFTVKFAPTTAGTKTAALHIANNDPDEAPFDINLSGSAYVPVPEIAIQQPLGTELNDGSTRISFGTVVIGKTGRSKTFTIKNTGTGKLTGLSITKNGSQAKDFIVGSLSKTSVLPGASATFKVSFKPTAKGTRNAAIHIKSNDSNESPFDIKLTGAGK
ncbi:MAG: choice-of-anchor D domain-containing protein [Verrucomicrobiota bacterium]